MRSLLFIICLISCIDTAKSQTNYINQSGNVGIGNLSPTTLFQVGAGTGLLHAGGPLGILFKAGTGDRSLMEIHSPDGKNRLILQSLSDALYLLSFDQKPLLLQSTGGKVAVGTDYPDANAMLTVKGQIVSQEIKVTTNAGADFVFDQSYLLPPLQDVAKFVEKNKHLPEVPSAKDMTTNGVELGKLNILLLQKVEELTLYLIQKDNQLQDQQKQINDLKKSIKTSQKVTIVPH
jgi:hypothetical protein